MLRAQFYMDAYGTVFPRRSEPGLPIQATDFFNHMFQPYSDYIFLYCAERPVGE